MVPPDFLTHSAMRRLLPVLLLLAACAAPPSEDGAVAIAKGISLVLPTPGDLGHSVEAVQMVTARRGGDVHVFEARLSVDPQRLLLVGTDSLGRRAMTVTWSEGRVTTERADWLPDTLRPENVLADIVLLYWPEAVVGRAVRGAATTQAGSQRRIGEAIAVAWDGDPWNGRVRLVNASFGYELEVRSVVVGP
jgi:hypothetical protein